MTAALRVELDSADSLLLESGMTIHKMLPLHIVFDDGRVARGNATYDVKLRRVKPSGNRFSGMASISMAHDVPARTDLRWVQA